MPSGPIIPGKLALRVAGIYDENEINGVRSVNYPAKPSPKTRAVRASLAFTPTEDVKANVTYQHIDREQIAFDPVIGSGGPSGIVPGTNFPAPQAG